MRVRKGTFVLVSLSAARSISSGTAAMRVAAVEKTMCYQTAPDVAEWLLATYGKAPTLIREIRCVFSFRKARHRRRHLFDKRIAISLHSDDTLRVSAAI